MSFSRIVCNPEVLVGKPIIKGTRIAVEHVLDRLADGWSVEQIIQAYPRLQREDVLAAVAFAAEVFREENFVAWNKVQAA